MAQSIFDSLNINIWATNRDVDYYKCRMDPTEWVCKKTPDMFSFYHPVVRYVEVPLWKKPEDVPGYIQEKLTLPVTVEK